MGAIKLNAEEFESTYSALNKAANSDLVDAVQNVGSLIKECEGDNNLTAQALENCKAIADTYNGGFYESLTKLKQTFDRFFDLSEYMEKQADIGSVSKSDTSFSAGKFDPSKVMA